ncbi:sensor histidine kinase [Actinophytocola algeriensis]|uniref:histidine kinase n=1 Tax=Actinophytocola algeriensis TaxID=1768010 RepID=A0A7W7Q5J4_9PSEU|nr:nitrate- and nitrite sensing domain-containing protein [Actinophytocola algeriensis]MBB4907389.1 signal transduction histidine kinase [Actinophytocola algeriensis]MBE1478872.1 signal transduction histidine kinase [Actinophytocola algeriensis]
MDGDSTTDSAVRRANAAIRAEQASGRPGKRRRFRLSEWRLPTKLMVVLLVPTLAALAFAGLRVYTQIKQANDLDYLLQQVELHSKLYEAADQIQKEGQVVAQFAARNRTGDRAPIDAQLQATDDAVAEVRGAAEAFYGESDESVRTEYERIFFRLDSLGPLREVASNSQFDGIAVASIYADIVANVLQIGQLARSDVGGGQLTPRLTALNSIATAKAQIAQQFSYITVAAQQGAIRVPDLNEIQAAVARHDSALATFNSVATPEELQRLNDTLVGPAVDQLKQNRQLLLVRGETGQNLGIVPNEVVQAGTSTLGLYRTIETGELTDLRDSISTLRNDQQEATLRDAAIVLAVLLLAVLLALLVARSLLKPLRVLRSNALDVAYSRLPQTVRRILADPDPVAASKNAVEPVPVFTREETGQLARSFDAVQEQAVLMATEQALLRDNINSIFVNLSRRSQALVERQLSLIDRLEQDEQDPDQLASLFELDHLATRMRRNSESLLVLSGTGLSRQLSRPVPASDVVGAAVSEVEHYARIEVASAPEVAVQGRAVSDLVHVIAELLDNATFFSPADKKVIVRMAMTRKKELAIQITDQGVGMSEDEIGATNARLADPPDLDVAVTRRMGLYVVARLAKRHNITVRLRDNEDIEGGLIARINVPAELVQPIGATPRSMASPSTTGSLAIADQTSTEARLNPPTNAPSRNSGIAGAFTGNMPRIRPEGTPAGADTAHDRTPAELSGYPPFNPGYEGSAEATTANGVPAEPPAPQNGRHDPADTGTALFGAPLPEAPVEDTSYQPFAGGGNTPSGEAELNVDAPTERLPIYEAVLSQWFEAADTGSAPPRGAGGADPAETATNGNGHNANGTNGTNGSANGTGIANGHVEAQAEPVEPTPWTSPGDDGWLAAQALLDDKTPDATTNAGLPKRVPKQHLLPGSAAPRHEARENTGGEATPGMPPLPPRTADAVRGRMSSFQQGVRRGRHALIEAYAGDQSGSEQSRQDEEQE